MLPIANLGESVLRAKTARVTTVANKKIQTLIDNMLKTVLAVDGVGLAAPQVHQSYRLFVITSHPNKRYPNAPTIKPEVIINARILAHSKKIAEDWEGCLSIPGIRGLVPRYQWIEAEYTNRLGKKERKKFTNFLARIFQHEFDHTNGIMFIDRVTSSKKLISEEIYQSILHS